MKMRITVEGKSYQVEVEILDEEAGAQSASPETPSAPAVSPGIASGAGGVQSPIAGNVLSILAKVGERVDVSDTLLILASMKLETYVASPYAGTVQSIHVKSGDAVTTDDVLVTLSQN